MVIHNVDHSSTKNNDTQKTQCRQQHGIMIKQMDISRRHPVDKHTQKTQANGSIPMGQRRGIRGGEQRQ